MCIRCWFYIFLYNISMYTSGKLGSSSIYVLTDFKKKRKKIHTKNEGDRICYTKVTLEIKG